MMKHEHVTIKELEKKGQHHEFVGKLYVTAYNRIIGYMICSSFNLLNRTTSFDIEFFNEWYLQ